MENYKLRVQKMENKKLRRSSEKKLIAGVCGGIAEYFQVEPILIRILFCIFFKIGLPLYIILWFFLPKKENESKSEPQVSKEAVAEVKPEVIIIHKSDNFKEENKPTSFIKKAFCALLFVFLLLFVYLPLTFILLGGTSYIIWGIFYPIINIDKFNFALMDLGIPGLILGIFASLVLFSTFIFIVTLASKIHFKINFLGKNGIILTLILFTISLFGTISSIGIIAFQNKVESSFSSNKEFALEENSDTITINADSFKEIYRSNIRLHEIKI